MRYITMLNVPKSSYLKYVHLNKDVTLIMLKSYSNQRMESCI